MPAAYQMSWNKSQRRWEKMHKGTRYWVTCTDLSLPPETHNKEDSYQAANEWWGRKLAELQSVQMALHPAAEKLKALTAEREYADQHGLADEVAVIDAEYELVNRTGDPFAFTHGDTKTVGVVLRAHGIDDPPEIVTTDVVTRRHYVLPDRMKRTTTPPEKTIGALIGKWISDIQDEARRGLRSPDGAAAIEVCIGKFKDFVGPSNPPDVITYDLWARWYNRCREMVAGRDAADGKRVKDDKGRFESWSADTAKKVFGLSRSFVRWLWAVEKLPALPRNLDDKGHKFDSEDKEPATFRTAEVHTLLKGVTGVHRLILLLSLNCGMYGKDISDLKKVQVDFEQGRITRRRSKTRRKKGSPKVSYKLWPETLELLRAHVNKDDNEPRALVTKSGKPWVWTETTDKGKKRKADNVATIFNNLKKRVGMTGPDKSFKVFRKTSASRMMRSERYRALRFLFLSHKPREVADRHYANAGRKVLDKAVNWLRKTYKLDELNTPQTAPNQTQAPP